MGRDSKVVSKLIPVPIHTQTDTVDGLVTAPCRNRPTGVRCRVFVPLSQQTPFRKSNRHSNKHGCNHRRLQYFMFASESVINTRATVKTRLSCRTIPPRKVQSPTLSAEPPSQTSATVTQPLHLAADLQDKYAQTEREQQPIKGVVAEWSNAQDSNLFVPSCLFGGVRSNRAHVGIQSAPRCEIWEVLLLRFTLLICGPCTQLGDG
ncbi:hypothetical protein V8F06_009385 [Rhypophila decipiens]